MLKLSKKLVTTLWKNEWMFSELKTAMELLDFYGFYSSVTFQCPYNLGNIAMGH